VAALEHGNQVEDGEERDHEGGEDRQRPGGQGRGFQGQPGGVGDEEVGHPERGEGVEPGSCQAAVAQGEHDGEGGDPGGEVAQAGWHGEACGELAERQREEEGDADHAPQLGRQHQPQVEGEQVAPEPWRDAVADRDGGDGDDLRRWQEEPGGPAAGKESSNDRCHHSTGPAG
jgi:hypothetical protein